jgi:hypothetical protein
MAQNIVDVHWTTRGSTCRWGYRIVAPDGEVLYVSPYRWSSEETAAAAGEEDREESWPAEPRPVGRPRVGTRVEVYVPDEVIERIDSERGPIARSAVIRELLIERFSG